MSGVLKAQLDAANKKYSGNVMLQFQKDSFLIAENVSCIDILNSYIP